MFKGLTTALGLNTDDPLGLNTVDPLGLNTVDLKLRTTQIDEFIKLIFEKSYTILISKINTFLTKYNSNIDILNLPNATNATLAEKATIIHVGEPIFCYTITLPTLVFDERVLGGKNPIRRIEPTILVDSIWTIKTINTLVQECLRANSLLNAIYIKITI